jgi:hypothetical protein
MTKIMRALVAVAAFTSLLAASGVASADPASTIVNPPTNPVHTSSVDDPGRIPYQAVFTDAPCAQVGSCVVILPIAPVGKRLVIQQVSAVGFITSATYVQIFVYIPSSGSPTPQSLAGFTNPVPTSLKFFGYTQTVQAYVDAGKQLFAQVSTDGSFTDKSVSITVTGYLLDCSVNQCAPIAP